jgi:hypothetical protein
MNFPALSSGNAYVDLFAAVVLGLGLVLLAFSLARLLGRRPPPDPLAQLAALKQTRDLPREERILAQARLAEELTHEWESALPELKAALRQPDVPFDVEASHQQLARLIKSRVPAE